ncbi:Phage tail sheath protein [Geosporobacter subterraneus DSM 17957]|uniref:Phage tail sheath protein n=1 Tax=Geosporobacter subterraneus DSM 17957 TaxID=1121919 RepID=A0A1M6M4C2_9FIRM|nr:phage tail sheath family protein [Geosporobacter subterraneus]SHJ78291.1 Phage tail sheath protein [Geosporobacter subterraneus DSM 17957]
MAPIGGGTFTVQNKILPGAYINFVSAGRAAQLGSRGVVALPLELNWGPENKVFAVTAEDFNRTAIDVFGYDPTDTSLLLVREALKRAKTLLAYRVNSGGQKASATVGGMAVTAKWGGTRGNDLKVAILTNADDATKVDVVTYLGTMEVDRQTVSAESGSANLKDNNFVTFGEAETLTPTSATALTGGSNGTVDGTAYSNFLNAIEVEAFNVIGYPGTDETIKALIAAFVKRLRYDNGVKIVGVLYQYDGDDIGLINVKNGVILADGTTITGDKAVAWVAGASAGAEVNESLTNVAYDGAVDVDIKYTKSQYEAAIQNGEFAFYADNGKARVLTDINSLVTFGDGVSEDWTSNRVVRVMDGWANDVARIFGERYIGTVTNSDTGRELFKADLVSLAMQYQAIDAISNFESADIVIQQGNGKRDVVVNCALQPNDSMEKLYMTVTVN